MQRKLGHEGGMRRIIYWLLVPVALAVATLFRIIDIGSIATLPGDWQVIVAFVTGAVKAIWAWLSGPPLWATSLALFVMTVAFVVSLFRDERLIRFSRIIFRKDARLAEFKLISNDDDLNRLYRAAYCHNILSQVDWRWPDFLVPDGRDYQFEALIGIREAGLAKFRPLDALLDGEVYKRAYELAQQRVAGTNPHWLQNDGLFKSDDERRSWNEAHAMHKELERIFAAIRSALAGYAGDWRPTTISAKRGFPRQLLEDIEAEIRR